ncbi:hypothetical protein Tco_1006050 [Tanacetum coccineum]|uniref:Uncharacterized protein n=1 Tax=Tanacetum coccineum TaxID=301880 RepID=A0ABQ5FIJ0_9ASTR
MAAWIIEKALEVALAGLKALAPGLLAKAAELLAKAAPNVVRDREALAQALTKLADTAMNLVHRALDFVGWSHSAVGKEVAKSAQEIADKLYEMARKLREDSSNMVQMEEGTHDAHVLALTYEVDVESMKRGIEEVEHQVEEVARLLKEHAELKVGEAGDNHPDKTIKAIKISNPYFSSNSNKENIPNSIDKETNAAWIIEKALEVALAGLKALAPGLLAKAAELLAKAAPKVVREAVAQALTKLADTAMKLVHRALDFVGWSHSAVGKEVAKSAQEIADKLYEMARKLRENSSNMVQTEEGTHDAHVLALTYEVDVESMKRGIEEVEHQVEEVARLLKEHAELKVGEAGDNHPDKALEVALSWAKAVGAGGFAKAARVIGKAAPKWFSQRPLAHASNGNWLTRQEVGHRALDFVGWSHSEKSVKHWFQTEEGLQDAPTVLASTYEVDAESSMKRGIEEVEQQVEEVARLLKEHSELKVGEAGDNHPDKGR